MDVSLGGVKYRAPTDYGANKKNNKYIYLNCWECEGGDITDPYTLSLKSPKVVIAYWEYQNTINYNYKGISSIFGQC